jgi:hypothetical protein
VKNPNLKSKLRKSHFKRSKIQFSFAVLMKKFEELWRQISRNDAQKRMRTNTLMCYLRSGELMWRHRLQERMPWRQISEVVGEKKNSLVPHFFSSLTLKHHPSKRNCSIYIFLDGFPLNAVQIMLYITKNYQTVKANHILFFYKC